jgi:hypothetical protein
MDDYDKKGYNNPYLSRMHFPFLCKPGVGSDQHDQTGKYRIHRRRRA